VTASTWPPRRGFTLIEMVVALGVSSIVIAGSLYLMLAQQRTFVSGASERVLQESGRVALQTIGLALRQAGYGLDPGMAFDLGATRAPQAQALLGPGETDVPFGGYQCANPVTCRDRIDGPDELVFLSRNPSWGHTVTALTTAQLTFAGPLATPLERGQVLQVACGGGDMYWAYVTVAAQVPAGPGPVTVTLGPANGTTFGAQNAALSDACFQNSPGVYLIDRYRFFLASYDLAGNQVAWQTPGARPYLMLDRGWLGADGNPALTVVAPDIEDLQIAYGYPLAARGTQLRGGTAGVRLSAAEDGLWLSPDPVLYGLPRYDSAPRGVTRTTSYPANIGSVRVGVVARAAEADATHFEPLLPALGNRPDMAFEANRVRAVFETSFPVPNLQSRAPIFPTFGRRLGTGLPRPADVNLNWGGG
jgi:type IV pilus assembly protein PilW